MVLLIPLILVAIYVGMYVLRTEKTGQCRWRQTGRRDTEAGLPVIDWACPVCGRTAQTDRGEPKHCGAKVPTS